MLKILMYGFLLLVFSACTNKIVFDQQADDLRLAIDDNGRITILEDVSRQTKHLSPVKESYLLSCQLYDSVNVWNPDLMPPISAKVIEKTETETKLELKYDHGVRILVRITPKSGYFKMEVTEATPIEQISHISWGPYYTTMRGPMADWLGLNRCDEFTLGLLSLEPNTDGGQPYLIRTASYFNEGSSLQLLSCDHTRGRFIPVDTTVHFRRSEPIPGLTVVGSAAALFGADAGEENELEAIEKIVLAENLPHPMFNGEWVKRSIEGKKLHIWAHYNEQNFKDHLAFCKETGARHLIRPMGFYSNWGHFDIDKQLYPGGIPSLARDSKEAKKHGVGTNLYSFGTFIKPVSKKEPYIAPIPDDRLQTWRPEAKISKAITETDTIIFLQYDKEVEAVLKTANTKVIRVDNEMIEFNDFSLKGKEIIATQCIRGTFHTNASAHAAASRARIMFVAGFHNFYPGTMSLLNEISDKLVDILVKTDQDFFIMDAFEAPYETGYGNYGSNMFMGNFYDKCIENNKEILVTLGGMSQYSWHFKSQASWGEFDLERGVRGSMLDYRISRQIDLRNNLIPKKLGQHYPNHATAEDAEWLMAVATGWDSGLDLFLNIDTIRQNPHYKRIVEILHLWTEARNAKIFTKEQKMALRQTDVQYKLSRKEDGTWDLKFDKFWQNENLKVLPPSVMGAKAVNGGENSVKPCSIDWFWTHNPGAYDEVGLSDDLVHTNGTKSSSWTVNYPDYTEREFPESWFPTETRYFQSVLRIPKDSPSGASNFKVSINNETMEIPVTLKPGEYISIPHIVPIACIYDASHKVIGEKTIGGRITPPIVKKGSTATVSVSCEPTEKNEKAAIVMNVSCQNGFFFQAK